MEMDCSQAVVDSDQSEDDGPLHETSVAEIMTSLFPLFLGYKTKKEAKCAARFASLSAFGKSIKVNNSKSNKFRLHFFCPGKSCQFEAVATCKRTRRSGGSGRGSGGQASRDTVASDWVFRIFTNGLNYIPHSEHCSAKGEVTKDVVQKILKDDVVANPNITGQNMKRRLCARTSPLSESNLCGQSTMYRARQDLRTNSNVYYNVFWERMESFLSDFQQANPACHVRLDKDQDNRFKRYFVGIHASIQMLQHCGLDFYGIDACFTRHHIVKGMQLHLLCGRTGENTNIIMACSLELTESSGTYQWFAEQCKAAGFGDLTCIPGGHIERNPVCFSDGFKGANYFPNAFPGLHHALCAKHLANAIRDTLKRWKKDPNYPHPVEVGFSNEQVIAVCTAKTDADFETALKRLSGTSRSAAGRLLSKDLLEWSVNAMSRNGIPTFGHCTSNVVEGTNGVLAEMRARHPYMFIVFLVRYVSERLATHQNMIRFWCAQKKLLTPFASTLFKKSRAIAQRRGYEMRAQANDTFLVCDPTSKNQVSGSRADMYSWLLLFVVTTHLLQFVFLFADTLGSAYRVS